MTKKRIYISGNANGSPEKVEQRFMEAELRLGKDPNHEVFNSYELGFAGILVNEDAKEWFELMLSCDAIYLLDGWFDSSHSISERGIMENMGKAVIYEKKLPFYHIFDKTERLRHLIHEYTGCDYDSIRAQGRDTEKYHPRVLFCYYCYTYLKISKIDISKLINRHRSSVLHTLEQYESLNKFCPEFKYINTKLSSAYFRE